MKPSPFPFAGLALAILLTPAACRGDFIPWMYNWSRSPTEVHADEPGTGYIALTDELVKRAVGDSDIVATNMRTFSSATPENPDRFTAKTYALTLNLVDVESGQSGTLTFGGQIDGELGQEFARLHNVFTGPATQSIVLGKNRYIASNLTFAPPGIPGAANAGAVSAHATILVEQLVQTPEPGSLALSGLGVFVLGLVRWRLRRRDLPCEGT